MKKHLIAAAVAGAFAVPAMAQVTVGGSINVGIVDSGAAGSDPVVTSLGGGANAINLSSTEDLGGGLRGGFTGQIRFNAATGDRNASGQGNALMHAANVFVGGSFGTVRIGKIAENGNCGFDPWGCTGGASLSTGVGVSALIASGTTANAVSYTSPTMMGLSFAVQTSLSTRDNERQVFNINYVNGPFSAQYLQSKGSANTAADNVFTTAEDVSEFITDVAGKGTSIGASYNFGFATLTLQNAVTKDADDVKTRDIMSLGATVPLGAVTVLAGYNKDDQAASNADTKWALGANYALSKRTTLGADVFRAEANRSTGFVIRARHTF